MIYEPSLEVSHSALDLTDDNAHYCLKSLRLQVGDCIDITNGKGLKVVAKMKACSKKKCSVIITEEKELAQADLSNNITAAVGMLKNMSRFEWFVEKAVELGIGKIIPLATKHVEKKSYPIERLQRITIAAMLQSQKSFLPEITPVMDLDKISKEEYATKLVALQESEQGLNKIKISLKNKTLFLVGPEGDFSAEEKKSLLEHNFQSITLSSFRLRTETAAITCLVQLLSHHFNS